VILLERLALDLVLAHELAATIEGEDLRRGVGVPVAQLVRADVYAPVRADRDGLGLAGRADLREHLDVERLARAGRGAGDQDEDDGDENRCHFAQST
jgi:hypothetical protein